MNIAHVFIIHECTSLRSCQKRTRAALHQGKIWCQHTWDSWCSCRVGWWDLNLRHTWQGEEEGGGGVRDRQERLKSFTNDIIGFFFSFQIHTYSTSTKIIDSKYKIYRLLDVKLFSRSELPLETLTRTFKLQNLKLNTNVTNTQSMFDWSCNFLPKSFSVYSVHFVRLLLDPTI